MFFDQSNQLRGVSHEQGAFPEAARLRAVSYMPVPLKLRVNFNHVQCMCVCMCVCLYLCICAYGGHGSVRHFLNLSLPPF